LTELFKKNQGGPIFLAHPVYSAKINKWIKGT